MNTIKFSCRYRKLNAAPDGLAQLIEVIDVELGDLSPAFIAYDTDGGQYKLPGRGKYMMLIFLGSEGIFTTLRSTYPRTKIEYYRSKIGEQFSIQLPPGK